ncbi:MAG: hypothetical protein P8X46_10540, partial [Nitrospirales bacterium]
FQFSGHMCPYASYCPDRKWIPHISRIGLYRIDKTTAVFGSGYNRSAFSRFVVKAVETILFI